MKSAAFILGTLVVILASAWIACGGDDDDDSDDSDNVDDDVDDDGSDDDGDDDDADDDEDDDTGDDDTTPTEWPGPPWYGCTDEDEPAEATVVTAIEDFDHDASSQNHDEVASFPTSGDWSKITMRLELECPADGDCDDWDRLASVFLVEDPGGPAEAVHEIVRYITPYNVGMCFNVDVSAFAPLLTGEKTIRSYVGTWATPGGSFGSGWRVTTKFIFHPGEKAEVPSEFAGLWSFQSVEVGNPDNAVPDQTGAPTADIPADATKVELRFFMTGHGQGNANNCAEFCHLLQRVSADATQLFELDPHRTDCSLNPIGPQQAGSWTYPRAGWCPGAVVTPYVYDVTGQMTPGATATFDYDNVYLTGDEYENTCRPGAGDASNICEGCVFHDGEEDNCDYNGGDHTQPVDTITAQLLIYR